MIDKESRQALRQYYRQYRQNLSPEQQKSAAASIVQTAINNNLFANSKKVACYLANDGELDLIQLIHTLWQSNIDTYLPVLHPFSKGHLLFIQYGLNTRMTTNRFGIPEPVLNVQNIIKPQDLDCVLVPLVAFDKAGNRLGMGGGFYDRTLAPLIINHESEKPKLIGVAHEGQMSAQLPYQGWDIPMQNILTPEHLLNTTK